MNPDILCLQETENHTGLHEFLKNELNFEGEFLKKDEESKLDGCATFYSPDKFVLIKKFEIHMGFNSSSDLYQKP